METRTLQYIAEACQGELRFGAPEAEVHGLSTDSRSVSKDDLFVALVGDKFDAHKFIDRSLIDKVGGALVERTRLSTSLPNFSRVEVGDTRAALGGLAARYREDYDARLVAVTGSNGKTTTKDLIASVLRQRFETLASEASFNNDVGVPLTLLQLESKHQAGVLEVGTNHPGEIAPLVKLVAPVYGVITTIGRTHLEFFGTVDNVAQEKGWLAELLPESGRLFINGDCYGLEGIVARTSAPVTRVGLGPQNHWRATSLRLDVDGCEFTVNGPTGQDLDRFRLNLIGRHQVTNALLAIAVGAEFGLSSDQIRKGLADCRPPRMRLQPMDVNGVRILNDAYNANEDSVLAALDALSELPCDGKRIAILGDMAELGDRSPQAHESVGRRVGRLGVDHLIAVGSMAGVMGGAVGGGAQTKVDECRTLKEAKEAVEPIVKKGDAILIKASRAAGLDRLVDDLATLKIS